RHTRFSRDWSSDVCSSDLISLSVQSLHSAQKDARVSLVKADLLELKKLALIAQTQSGLDLHQITGQSCSACVCQDDNLNSSNCVVNQSNAFRNLSNASEGLVHLNSSLLSDPWGAPYLINERQYDTCLYSLLFSAGPDKKISTNDDNLAFKVEGRNCN